MSAWYLTYAEAWILSALEKIDSADSVIYERKIDGFHLLVPDRWNEIMDLWRESPFADTLEWHEFLFKALTDE